jgi:hypothetical protein
LSKPEEERHLFACNEDAMSCWKFRDADQERCCAASKLAFPTHLLLKHYAKWYSVITVAKKGNFEAVTKDIL